VRLGIVESLGLLASLVFAIPVGIAGGSFLLDGRTAVGATLVVVALLMVIVPRRVVAPQDLPGELAERLVGRAVRDPEGTETAAGEREDAAEGGEATTGRDGG
jgi:hypothetical protein